MLNIYQYLYTDIYFFTFVIPPCLNYNYLIETTGISQGGFYNG